MAWHARQCGLTTRWPTPTCVAHASSAGIARAPARAIVVASSKSLRSRRRTVTMAMLHQAFRSPGTLGLALYRRGVKLQPSQWRSVGAHASVECSSSSYETLAQPTTMIVEVKKSKFIVTAWPVDNASQAMELIQDASEPSASHNCWAYQVAQEFRSSDDGEPSGTAGKPILGAIQGEGLDYTAVLVTRYFGGVKLGAGGLVRAYGGAARDCLRAAPKEVQVATVPLVLSMTYNEMGSLYGQLDRLNATRTKEEEYLDNGLVRVEVAVASDREREFVEAVSNITAGSVVPQRCGPSQP